ncbi:potassium/sodium hyperpolarization-activated cyclic nucleotide-gated channel 1 [Histomonas meleagridis]|uniref:potassium/sodium hyperpolarization-activated cyclic nucleotide-gated channel 1 n=1 Tax=Histomonas meleagridis TaxID=135588 RepID=UPI003559A88B|nr:potassium/sodium hyperpolarization-activated cyclic nucleotide-gated channel 1 [Histomonas meleagridis]KAH0800062.1 potassium/sodium hyperpolarization-activated cyclic nucleotide-gated channel 1 [Histomonas meleagridis]
MEDHIVINTRQLQHIIGKCKSSINNGIQAIGYVLVQTTAEIASELGKLFPFLKSNFSEMRQWTVRKLVTKNIEETKNMPISESKKIDLFDFNPFTLKIEDTFLEEHPNFPTFDMTYIPDQLFVDQDPVWFH